MEFIVVAYFKLLVTLVLTVIVKIEWIIGRMTTIIAL